MNRSRRESNPHLRFRKPLFYPLNYGNNDNCDFRFAIADCKWRRRSGLNVFVVSRCSSEVLIITVAIRCRFRPAVLPSIVDFNYRCKRRTPSSTASEDFARVRAVAMHGGLVVSRGALTPASFLLQLLNLFRSFRFGPILIELFASFAAECLEIRALRASHRLIFCYPFVGIFLRIECCRRHVWRNVVRFHQRQIRVRSCCWTCRKSYPPQRATRIAFF